MVESCSEEEWNVLVEAVETAKETIQEIKIKNSKKQRKRRNYDKNGNITKAIDANGHTATYVYDKETQIVEMKDASGNTIRYTYDGNGNVLTETDAKGAVTTYTYDGLGNQKTVTNAHGKTAKNE